MILVGIDENGLGPKLGPLVVTGVALEVADYRPAALRTALSAALSALPEGEGSGVGDSKQTLGFARMAEGEPVVLGMLAAALGTLPGTFADLFRAITRRPVKDLQAHCPKGAFPMCWTPDLPLPLWCSPAAIDLDGGRMRAVLAEHGVRLRDVAVAISCPGWLNRDLAYGVYRNKLHLEFSLLESLLVRFREGLKQRIVAHCGRLGGTRTGYPEFFGELRDEVWTGPYEQEGTVSWSFARLGDVSFVDDAESCHPAVALASMIGKYVREAFMMRLNGFFARWVTDLRPTSGYHNAVTEAFEAATAAVRERRAIPDRCFRRDR